MAVIFMDSFDHYSFASGGPYTLLLRKYDGYYSSSSVAYWTSSSSPRREGSSYLVLAGQGGTIPYIEKSISLTTDYDVIIGFAYRRNLNNYNGNAHPLLTFLNSANSANFTVYASDDGALHGLTWNTYNESYCIGHTGTGMLPVNTWTYIEVRAKIADTGGIFQVKINGSQDYACSVTGADTQYTSTAGVSKIRIGGLCSANNYGGQCSIDDLYIIDPTVGTTNLSMLGDVKVVYVLPAASGSYSQWTASPSGANYTCVDDTSPNDSDDFVQTDGVGNIDTYNFDSLVGVTNIYALSVTTTLCKGDAYDRRVRGVARIESTNYSSDSSISMSTDWTCKQAIFDQNPATSSSWTVSAVDNSEFGIILDN
jgi:hypothetical protein